MKRCFPALLLHILLGLIVPARAYTDAPNLAAADALFNQGQFTEARPALLAFIAANPGSSELPRVAYEAAECLFNTGDYESFKQEVARYKEQYPASPLGVTLELHQALIPYYRHDWAGARAAMQSLMDTHPDSDVVPSALFYQAVCLVNAGEDTSFTLAAADFQRRFPQHPLAQDLAVQQVTLPCVRGRWDGARAPIEAYIAAHPEAPSVATARYYSALCQWNVADYTGFSQAVEDFRHRHPGHSHLDTLEFHKATIPAERDEWTSSVKTLKAFVASHPASPSIPNAKFNLGVSLYHTQAYDEATSVLEECQRIYPMGSDNYLEAKLIAGATLVGKAGVLSREGQTTDCVAMLARGRAIIDEYIFDASAPVLGHAATMTPAEIRESDRMVLTALYYKMDYDALIYKCADLAALHPDDLFAWVQAKAWQGVALCLKSPNNHAAASTLFDEVLARDYGGVTDLRCLEYVAVAAEWRGDLARRNKDTAKIEECRRILAQLPDNLPKIKALSHMNY